MCVQSPAADGGRLGQMGSKFQVPSSKWQGQRATGWDLAAVQFSSIIGAGHIFFFSGGETTA